jgi:hypothetical protein
MTETELKTLCRDLIRQNGYRAHRVLAVRPTDLPDVWTVSCMADGAMDALVTYKMDARTGLVSTP